MKPGVGAMVPALSRGVRRVNSTSVLDTQLRLESRGATAVTALDPPWRARAQVADVRTCSGELSVPNVRVRGC